MKLIDKHLFLELCANGELAHFDCEYLNDIKIGLRINPVILKFPKKIDFRNIDSIEMKEVNLNEEPLLAGNFYLAKTVERLCVSKRVLGFIHTRSRWAKLGLDCLGSSNFLSPGFGNRVPESLVLEIRPAIDIYNIDVNIALAAVILFQLEQPIEVSNDS
jgi:deoxycytidine triphosphate deaminase